MLSAHGKALVIDPGVALPVIEYLQQENLELIAILATHKHWDHTQGIAPLLEKFSCPVYGPFKDQVPGATLDVIEGQVLNLGPFPAITVLEIPGHTYGHVAYLMGQQLFCGDTLFLGGCGRVLDGTYEALFASLQKLAALPQDTQVYCAHEYTLANLQFALKVEPENSALEQRFQQCEALRKAGKISVPGVLSLELMTNPFLRTHVPQIKERVQSYAEHELCNDFEVFKALRDWKNQG